MINSHWKISALHEVVYEMQKPVEADSLSPFT